jgi:hypothetical protein
MLSLLFECTFTLTDLSLQIFTLTDLKPTEIALGDFIEPRWQRCRTTNRHDDLCWRPPNSQRGEQTRYTSGTLNPPGPRSRSKHLHSTDFIYFSIYVLFLPWQMNDVSSIVKFTDCARPTNFRFVCILCRRRKWL